MSETHAAAQGAELAQRSIQLHSKSFAVASRLLPQGVRRDVFVLYAYCRRVDDAIDLAPAPAQAAALSTLRRELDSVYAGEPLSDPLLAQLARGVRERALPRHYPEELIEGMAMDVQNVRYHDEQVLILYCYRVAAVVGLMMCHVMGVRDDRALPHAACMGIAMQLTNICRDVLEDFQRGRLYLPDALLAKHGAADLRAALGGPMPDSARAAVACATAELLALADHYYAAGDAGLGYLGPRCALAVRAARSIYSDIGRRVHAQRCDPYAGRAYTSGPRKLWLVLRAAVQTVVNGGHGAASALVAPSRVLPLNRALLEAGAP